MEEEIGDWKRKVTTHLHILNWIKYLHCAAKIYTNYTFSYTRQSTLQKEV